MTVRRSLRTHTLNGEPIEYKPPVADTAGVWTGSATTPAKATEELARKTAEMTARGYVLRTSFITPVGRPRKVWLLGIFGIFARPRVQASATFERHTRTPSADDPITWGPQQI